MGAFHARTLAALHGLDFELIVVDDGSRDATGERLRALAATDERVKLVSLSRNFGHQAAISAGLEHARGDVVVMIDGDLQDPPELIPEMLDAWRRGADVVYAVRESRAGETQFKLASARWFYKLFAKLARIELAPDSGDFRLMDRAPLDALLSMPERNRFLRGMTVWVGFTQTAVTVLARGAQRRPDQVHAPPHAALRVRRDHVVLARAAAGGDAARLRLLRARLPRHPAGDRRALRRHLLARRAVDDRDHPAAGRDPAHHRRDHRRVRRADLRRGQAPAAVRRARARQRRGARPTPERTPLP